jgi:hypothetical protein
LGTKEDGGGEPAGDGIWWDRAGSLKNIESCLFKVACAVVTTLSGGLSIPEEVAGVSGSVDVLCDS